MLGGIFGTGPIGCGCIDMACVPQESCVGLPPGEYAASLMNKPTVSFTDTTLLCDTQVTMRLQACGGKDKNRRTS